MKFKYMGGSWHHHRQIGTDELILITHDDGHSVKARIWEEEVTTGKQRVHAGYQTQVDTQLSFASEEEEFNTDYPCWSSGIHRSKLQALHAVAEQMKKDGYRLDVWGIDPGFYETGLSSGSGYGYSRGGSGRGAVRAISGRISVPKDVEFENDF